MCESYVVQLDVARTEPWKLVLFVFDGAQPPPPPPPPPPSSEEAAPLDLPPVSLPPPSPPSHRPLAWNTLT